MTDTRILHVATDRAGRTWRLLEREDGSFSLYYTQGDTPGHHVLYDSLDQWTDPPRVLRERAERAEQKVWELERKLKECGFLTPASAGGELDYS